LLESRLPRMLRDGTVGTWRRSRYGRDQPINCPTLRHIGTVQLEHFTHGTAEFECDGPCRLFALGEEVTGVFPSEGVGFALGALHTDRRR
jgi:hypothetical protein